MGIFIWTSLALLSLYPLFFTCEVSATSTQLISNLRLNIFNVCDLVYCGKGTCHLSSSDLLGFRCDCDSGWKKPNIGSFQLPPCALPNCTVDLNCGNGSSSLPSSPPTTVNDPCLLNLCGDGTCESNGSDFRCKCNEGSANLLDDPKLICIKKCTLGGDCEGFHLGFDSSPNETQPPPEKSGTSASPPTSPTAGSGETLRCIRGLHVPAMLILALIFELWI
ncbi:hypothetical protein DEO72_LG8g88 [Vigna unguiculata]|uniref:EGF-like domain-containing protein n=1 Tax=Vigna unguiculata TaxID=3917 RepID=A0A4D6MQ97_VIGUN|nr:hypothetical protein DEO72_LG8g88 [Vigna unguiculata]